MSGLLDRVAGAPITWGVCEVTGWGHQMSPQRVLQEMAGIGLKASELGPDGFLPADPQQLAELLESYQLQLAGGFVPAVLHQRHRQEEELAIVERQAKLLAAGGAEMLVLAAASGEEGYDDSTQLDYAEWGTLVEGLDKAGELARRLGLEVSLHPHYGTVIERPESIDRLLSGSEVGLCLDTGHVMLGGGDPATLANTAATRIRHVHLKDVNSQVASRVRSGELGYRQAAAVGLYRPLGEGDVDIRPIVSTLEASGYRGWYVLEQDAVLTSEPAPKQGPMADAYTSVAYLRRLERESEPESIPGAPPGRPRPSSMTAARKEEE